MPMAPTVDVSILVVSYNTCALTRAAIESVVDETRSVSFEIIAVDNASHDGSAAMLRNHPGVSRLISLQDNIGFARANNLAAEYARGRYVLLLNPDTVVLDGAIDRLVAFADQNKRALIWGGRTKFEDGSLNPTSVWRQLTPWSLACRITGLTAIFPSSEVFNPEAYGAWQRDRVRHVDIISGCFFMMPKTVWTSLGGFDPVYFMYGEEADLCLRAKRIGAQPLFTPEAEIIHYGGKSEATRAGKMTKLLSALATLIDRHWPAPMNNLGQHMLLAWPLTRWLVLAAGARLLNRSDWQSRSEVWKDIWDNRDTWRFGYAKAKPNAAELAAQTAITKLPGSKANASVMEGAQS